MGGVQWVLEITSWSSLDHQAPVEQPALAPRHLMSVCLSDVRTTRAIARRKAMAAGTSAWFRGAANEWCLSCTFGGARFLSAGDPRRAGNNARADKAVS